MTPETPQQMYTTKIQTSFQSKYGKQLSTYSSRELRRTEQPVFSGILWKKLRWLIKDADKPKEEYSFVTSTELQISQTNL